MEVRFDYKWNGKPLKGLRTFQKGNSGCSTNDWEGDRVKGVRPAGRLFQKSR